MKKKGACGFAIVLCGLLFFGGCGKEQRELTEHQQKWIIDIDTQLREELSQSAGITQYMSDDERNEKIDKILAGIQKEGWDDDQVVFAVRKLISDFGIGHMGFSRSSEYVSEKELLDYPVIGKWFGEDYYVVAVQEGNERALGCRLVAINGMSLDDILALYDDKYPTETRSNLLDCFERDNSQGFSEVDLSYFKIKKADSNTVAFTMEQNNGERFEIEVPAVKLDANADIKIIELMANKVLPFGDRIYQETEYAPFTYIIDTDNRAVYFQYNECYDSSILGADSGYPDFSLFVDEMIADMQLHEKEWDCFIIDLRNNRGGSEVLWNDALEKCGAYLNQFPIKILIGKATFSAANDVIDAALYKLENVTLYGEETGLAVHNYTEVKTTVLEQTGCVLYTTRHEDFSYVLSTRAGDTSRGVLPDVEIIQSFQNYVDGIDDVYLSAVQEY